MKAPEQKVSFRPPPGAVPEGTALGEDFDLVCTFRVEQGGQVCLTLMGDHKMPGTSEGAYKHEPKPSYTGEAQAMQQMSTASSGAGGYG